MGDTETCHFWIGDVPEETAGQYFVESWDDDDEDAPISAFARDQGVTCYDHDFLEYGWGNATSIEELVAKYSYSDQWAAELSRRVAAAGSMALTSLHSSLTAKSRIRSLSKGTVIGCSTWVKSHSTSKFQPTQCRTRRST